MEWSGFQTGWSGHLNSKNVVNTWIQLGFKDGKEKRFLLETKERWLPDSDISPREYIQSEQWKRPTWGSSAEKRQNEKGFRKIILAALCQWNWSKKDSEQGSQLNCCCRKTALKWWDPKLGVGGRRDCWWTWKRLWFKRFCVLWRLHIKLG